MRLWTLLAAGLVAAVALAPGASAQVPTGVSLELTAPEGNIPYDASTEIPFTVTVGCISLLEAGAAGQTESPEAAVTSNAPAYLGIQNTTVGFSPDGCVTGTGFATGSGSLSVTPTSMAPGMSTIEVTITATLGSESTTQTVPITVDYRMGYTWSTDATFPVELTEDTFSFNITVEVDTNAPTMVMFERTTAPLGNLPAPFPYTFNDPLSTSTHVIPIEYQAPATSWTNDTVAIKTWSHYLNDGSMKTGDEEMVFTFTNAGGASGGGDGGDGDKDSPGLALPLLLALLGAALVVLRRRS